MKDKKKCQYLTHICYVALCVFVVMAISGCISHDDRDGVQIDKQTDNILYNHTNDIKFVVVGDPHIKVGDVTNRGNERLMLIVDFVNKLDIDFVVFMGDMTEHGTAKENDIVKSILRGLTKPYYVVAGNHDIYVSQKMFESYYGPMEHIENVKGYQLIFVGIRCTRDTYGKIKSLNWSFDFHRANDSLPTLIFLHGAVVRPPSTCDRCKWNKFFRYGSTMQPKLRMFKNLVGVYSGHVHYDSMQEFDDVKYITVNGLIAKKVGGVNVRPSDYIGYSIIRDGVLSYRLMHYNDV